MKKVPVKTNSKWSRTVNNWILIGSTLGVMGCSGITYKSIATVSGVEAVFLPLDFRCKQFHIGRDKVAARVGQVES